MSLHWLWFVLVGFEFMGPRGYEHRIWNLIEILSIFGIVLVHEFGHALACRSVGGRADRIVLWLLGGVAFVQPPPRPGAVLWSIAAGPLVNVILIPVTVCIYFVVASYTQMYTSGHLGDLHHYALALVLINFILLVFNMIPVYPLDGGQILQSLLWFWLGRARSLQIVATIGLVVGGVGALAALVSLNPYIFFMAFFIAWQSFNGYRVARMLAAADAKVLWPPPPSR